jgi:hypothetical protein
LVIIFLRFNSRSDDTGPQLPSLKKVAEPPQSIPPKEISPPVVDLSFDEEEEKLARRLEEIRELKIKMKPILEAIIAAGLPYDKVLDYLRKELRGASKSE